MRSFIEILEGALSIVLAFIVLSGVYFIAKTFIFLALL